MDDTLIVANIKNFAENFEHYSISEFPGKFFIYYRKPLSLEKRTMAYKLTLSYEDRKAIEWIGYRYFHGDELYEILEAAHYDEHFNGQFNEEWNTNKPITFTIEECLSWLIKGGIEAENYELACFAPVLRAKLIEFCDHII